MLVKKPIYLDYNATTPIDPSIISEMPAIASSAWGNPSCVYESGVQAAKLIDTARQQIAECIHAAPEDRVVFTSCATESINLAIKGVVMQIVHNKPQTNGTGKHAANGNAATHLPHIILSAIEHIAVLDTVSYLETHGYAKVTRVPVTRHGVVTVDSVVSAITDNTVLVSIMLANNEIGSINDVGTISAAVKQRNASIIVHTDASQACGKIDVNVKQLGVDMLTIAGHKLYAPKGVGALYIRSGVEGRIERQTSGANHESGLRAGTENTLYAWALGKACSIAKRDLDGNFDTMLTTRNILYDTIREALIGWTDFYQHRSTVAEKYSVLSLNKDGTVMIKLTDDNTSKAMPLMEVNTDIFTHNNALPNTLSVSFAYVNATELIHAIHNDVSCSAGAACHSVSLNTNDTTRTEKTAVSLSHVLQEIGVADVVGMGTIRLSTGKMTSVDEVREAAKYIAHAAIEQLVKRFYPFLSTKLWGS